MRVTGFNGEEVEIGNDFCDNEEYVKFDTHETGMQIVTLLMGWETVEAFETETCTTLNELQGKWFTTSHDRIFLKEQE